MNSEVDTLEDNILTEEEADNTITHLRTDDGSLRYPISITDAIFMDNQEKVNLTQYLQEMGTSTLFAKQIFAIQFTQDSDGYYVHEFQNPFDTNKVICNMRNTAGENLVCACTITSDTVQVTLVEPEDCWVLLTGDNIGNVVVDGGGSDAYSHSHANKATLDRIGNLDGRLTYGGNALAYESLIGDLSKINGTNIVDILLKMCEMLDIDLGTPDTPDIPTMDPVLSSTTSSIINNKLDNETIIIRYSFTSDTATNTLYIIIDDVESTQAVTNTSGNLTVGPFEEGSHTVILMIEDTNGNLSNELTFTISVIAKPDEPDIPDEPVVPAPILETTSSSTLSFNSNETISIEYSYESATDSNSLYYMIDNQNPILISMTEKVGSGTLQVGPIDAGTHRFEMYLMDSNLKTSETIVITFNVSEAPTEGKLEDIIINQFYSAGGKTDGPVSDNFIELYNTSDFDINIYSLYIHQAGGTTETTKARWGSFGLSAAKNADSESKTLILPAHTSFFILMNPAAEFPRLDLTNVEIYGKPYNLAENCDATWSRATISNKYAKLVLSKSGKAPSTYNPLLDENVIDFMVAANEDSTTQIEAEFIDKCLVGLSKQKSVRRKDFQRSALGNSKQDCEIIDWRIDGNIVYAPRSMEVGPWEELEQAEFGDEKIESNGIAVVKIILADDQMALLKQNKDAVGKLWYYNATQGNRTIDKYAEISYQHYSGKQNAKENFKIKLYEDELLTVEFEKKFETEGFTRETWPKLDNFVLKGNRKDPSHAHNIVTSNIIRQSYISNCTPTLLNGDTHSGLIDGFPIVLYINDVKQGIYTFNLPQHRKVYGIEKGDYNAMMFRGKSDGGDVSETVRFRALCEFTDDQHNEWEDRYPEAYEKEELSSYVETNKSKLNRLISFVMNTNSDNFFEEMGNYLDPDYLIDYFIWMYFGGFMDSAANNLNLLSYDGNKFYTTFYDMDATFGLNHDGDEMIPTDSELFENYRTTDSLLWEKLFESNATATITRRYKTLRQKTMNKEFILAEFDKFWSLIPESEQADDEAIWPSELMGDSGRLATHRAQLEAWLTEREIWCDAQLGNN